METEDFQIVIRVPRVEGDMYLVRIGALKQDYPSNRITREFRDPGKLMEYIISYTIASHNRRFTLITNLG